MNERIQKLMGQTLDEKFSGTWSVMDMQDLTKFADRFAELIINECLACADRMADSLEKDEALKEALGASWAALAIARRYGLS